jgi:hypothetical protein
MPTGSSGRWVLKKNPVESIARTATVEGLVVRRQVLGADVSEDKPFAAATASKLMREQRPDGSWGGTIVDTAGAVGVLLDLGVDPVTLTTTKRWLYSRRISAPGPLSGMFDEQADTRKGGELHRRFVANNPLFSVRNSCGLTPVIVSATALQALFRMGDDVATAAPLADAVRTLLSRADSIGKLCGSQIRSRATWGNTEAAGRPVWERSDLRLLGEDAASNPGVQICPNYFLRAVSFSPVLRHSPMARSALAAWRDRQESSGEFRTNSYLYNFYFAVDTLRHFADEPDAQAMFSSMVPAILRRQRSDGLWRKDGAWLPATYCVVRALFAFGYLTAGATGDSATLAAPGGN